jgi:FixJ family two-component response regulator
MRVVIVDDDEAVREGLKALLEVHGYAVDTFESANALLAAPESLAAKPACLLVDVRMPGMGGLELQRELKRRDARLPVIMITGHGDIPMAVAALKAGAADFLEKPFDSHMLLASIAEASRRAQSGADGVDVAEIGRRLAELTPREREVMELVIAGMSNKVIAHSLNIAVRTVEIHRARVMEKSGARSLAELVRLAIRLEQANSG